MRCSRLEGFAGFMGLVVFATVAACATTNSEGDGGPEADAPSGGRIDADPEAPDAEPKPDVEPMPDAQALPDAPPMVDAQPLPDAPPGTPDATPCMPTTMNLLANPSFDLGRNVSWSETSAGAYEIVVTTPTLQIAPHSPAFATWIGGDNNSIDQVFQDVAIPAATTAIRLKGQRLVATQETVATAFDKLFFEIQTPGGVLLEPVGGAPTFSNLNTVTAFTPFDFPLTGNYAGQTIRVRLHGTTDVSLPTNFFLDSIALEATVCQ